MFECVIYCQVKCRSANVSFIVNHCHLCIFDDTLFIRLYNRALIIILNTNNLADFLGTRLWELYKLFSLFAKPGAWLASRFVVNKFSKKKT